MQGRHALLGAALAAALGIGLGSSCTEEPLAPLAGLAGWREGAAFAVRDGSLDLAGGNLLLRRTDLTLETRLGTQAVTHVYNSATDRWSWSFEMTYAGGVFTDDTGMRHELAASAPGAIPGTRWRKVDGATLETRGGLRFGFDAAGRLARVHWRHALFPALELTRPPGGPLRIAQCTAPGACSDLFVVDYDPAGRVTGVRDRAGRQVEIGYEGGRTAWVQTPFGRENGLPPRRYHAVLDARGRPAALFVESPEREWSAYELDPLGRVTSYTLPGEESPRWRFQHQGSPARTLVTDPLGYTTRLVFGDGRRLGSVTREATGERTRFGWTGFRVTRVTTPDGLVTTSRFDAADELVERVLPSGRRLELEYAPGALHLADPFSALPARVRDGGTLIVARSFDAQGRLASETNGAGERTSFHYGPLETVDRVELPDGRAIAFAEYGEHGQPLELRLAAVEPSDPDFVERRELDAVGNLTLGVDPRSESGSQFPGVVARTFDADRNVRSLVMSQEVSGELQDIVLLRRSDGRVRSVQRPYGATAEFEYDALGRLRARRERVDGRWVETRYAWTPRGELAREELPNGMTRELAYDAAGRLLRRTQRRHGAFESEIVYGYEAGRLVRKDDSTTPGPTLVAYDAAGRPSAITWPDGERSHFAYDARDRLLTTTLLQSDGSLLRQLGVRYDAAGREVRLLDGAAVVHEEAYAGGRLVESRSGNGVVRTLGYDEFGRPTGATSRDAAGVQRESETIGRAGFTLFGKPDPNGSILELTVSYQATAASGPVTFEERAQVYRFRGGQRWWARFLPDGTYKWCHGTGCDLRHSSHVFLLAGLTDLDSERLPADAAGTKLDRLFERSPERSRLHATWLRPATPEDGSWDPVVEHRYTWDEAGFATSRDGVPITWDAHGQVASYGSARFARDAEGRLRGLTVAGVATTRRFGGLVEADAHGRPAHIDLGAVAIDLVAGRRTYRHFDWRGNVRSVWDDTGTLHAVREYEAYGPARLHGQTSDPRGFAQGLEAAGLVLLGARLYDAAARQFLGPDPIYSVLHQHVYAAGDPTSHWDWTGRSAETSAGFRLAGAYGQLIGAMVGIPVGIGAGLALRNVSAGIAIGFGTSAQTGVMGRALAEYFYIKIYDRLYGSEEDEDRGGKAEGASGLLVPSAFAGPSSPAIRCFGGECFIDWDGSRGEGTPPRFSSGRFDSIDLSGLPAPAACGLLGVEALPLFAWCLWRKRGRRTCRRAH